MQLLYARLAFGQTFPASNEPLRPPPHDFDYCVPMPHGEMPVWLLDVKCFQVLRKQERFLEKTYCLGFWAVHRR